MVFPAQDKEKTGQEIQICICNQATSGELEFSLKKLGFLIISYCSLPMDNSLWHMTLWQIFQDNFSTFQVLSRLFTVALGEKKKPSKEVALLVCLGFSENLQNDFPRLLRFYFNGMPIRYDYPACFSRFLISSPQSLPICIMI